MPRWQCPIYNGSLKSFVISLNVCVFLENVCFIMDSLRKGCANFCLIKAMEKLLELNTFRVKKTTVTFNLKQQYFFQALASDRVQRRG